MMAYEICQKVLKIMAKSLPKTPKIRAIGVTCRSLYRLSNSPLFIEERRREELIKALDRINNRYGESTIYPAITVLTRQ